MIRSSKNDAKKIETPISAPQPEASPISSSMEREQSQSFAPQVQAERVQDASPTAIIGPKIRFKGELIGEEDLLIQGYVEGTIDLKGNKLIVGKQGVIKANVLAKTISIEGTVEGDVFGEERISILSSSNVKGNLVADRVTLEDGAKFRGSIDMETGAQNSPLKDFGFPSSTANKPAPAFEKEKSETSEPA